MVFGGPFMKFFQEGLKTGGDAGKSDLAMNLAS